MGGREQRKIKKQEQQEQQQKLSNFFVRFKLCFFFILFFVGFIKQQCNLWLSSLFCCLIDKLIGITVQFWKSQWCQMNGAIDANPLLLLTWVCIQHSIHHPLSWPKLFSSSFSFFPVSVSLSVLVFVWLCFCVWVRVCTVCLFQQISHHNWATSVTNRKKNRIQFAFSYVQRFATFQRERKKERFFLYDEKKQQLKIHYQNSQNERYIWELTVLGNENRNDDEIHEINMEIYKVYEQEQTKNEEDVGRFQHNSKWKTHEIMTW